jgi:signal transduction histidine kinase
MLATPVVLHSFGPRVTHMPAEQFSDTVEHFAVRLSSSHAVLAAIWLERLDQLLDVEARQVFPSHQLLDHIPELIDQIASYLRAPGDQAIAADTVVMAKAAELGLLRFDQRASVHQVLREYQIFSEILEEFFAREVAALGSGGDAIAVVQVLSRAQQAVRVLMQQTVDAFITRYTETIERQNAQLRNFSRLVSHEIRQPLGVLQVLTRVLPVPDGDAESLRLRDTLDRNVSRLGAVAGMLERLARLTRADNALNEQRVDLTSLVRDVARQLSDMAESRGVSFIIDEQLPMVVADAGRLELVMMNLLANAVKYSDPVKASRVVRVESDAGSPQPCVRIRDNGLGIPPAKLAVIFDQFVRVHAHLDDELGAQGMGLGLSIVRECMDAMSGSVRVESTDGVGTTFTLEWPPETARA